MKMLSATQWNNYYCSVREIAFLALFTCSEEENVHYTIVLNDIKMELIKTNRLHAEIFKEKNLTTEQQNELNNWERFCTSLNTFHSKQYREPKELERIAHQLNIEIDSIEEVGIGDSGCRKFIKDGKTYYLKPFFYIEFNIDKGINPKEPFLYKVLEYIGLGPHTEFFIGSSTAYGSTSNYLRTNFIMTIGEESE